MKKSKTAVKSQPLGKKKDTRGIKYFLWILPFLILVFLFLSCGISLHGTSVLLSDCHLAG